jgi:CHAD domain-containing protein
MSYRIDLRKEFQAEIKRIISDQLSSVTSKINDRDVDFDEKVHASRKHFKKIRAIWRLIRDDIGQDNYQNENRFYRDLGRKMASMREAKVYLNTIEALEDSTNEDQVMLFPTIKDSLIHHYRVEKIKFTEDHLFDQVTEQVEQGKQRVNELKLKNNDFDVCKVGIKRVYKRGVKTFHRAKSEPTAEHLHEWRKRVKYLWYHVRLLRDVWKPVMKGYEKSLDNLSDYLGDEHDLSELEVFLEQNLQRDFPKEAELLKKRIAPQKKELQSKAWPVGEKIYAEQPKKFVNRLEFYYEIQS